MSVKKEANGRRSVQVEVEVPGTPEQVWQAIATGPGVGAWFVPTEIDGRVGGTVTTHFGGGMDSVSTITEWDAPHRFVKRRVLGAERAHRGHRMDCGGPRRWHMHGARGAQPLRRNR